ncbi:type II toxin-antitoxin system HicB family antitoxin [Ralstonia solanacearum P673]|uniref:type II toxin-antitoxin system HicB family antitoxin n=1 Tax=Ralstonia solanacearum TaxID=305 RepID=UPI00057EFC90|nr:type II toxin-antitoxin system HicB family antitoxin [Ralstonia solanacearum]MCL9852201.1 type II toxin-antitoxin system HicB family antitoxin [Ralstonia solanacearum]MCL9857039.1 type II toxin-antitoxin system HicB family antitoxin [Ralstonia solanacearum]MCL9861856.1 type II toxin-antitoxin system HicB family antitoxin [Ralstonia solanacearum]MCL9866640.1 type II toxin-antitoxin system HicB family antitoxin [Ralstonia solanacearum]MCL9871429.1 type II toxin-antitoxin system HicB family an
MQFPIAIHKDEGSVYGVTVPDIPGVHSWGDTIDDAVRNTREAIAGHLQTLVELGEDVDVTCSTIEDLATREEYSGAVWALVDVDAEELDRTPERINVSLPRFVLKKLDRYAERRHETRSGLLARAAMELMSHS